VRESPAPKGAKAGPQASARRGHAGPRSVKRVPSVHADAVDAPGPHAPRLFGTLPPRAEIVAESLLQRGTLRSQPPGALARLLAVRESDAREGIAAVVGMLGRTAQGDSRGDLRPEPALCAVVGDRSLDQAMARFASDVAPSVRSPNPVRYRDEAGDVDPSLWDAAAQLLSFLQQNGCRVSPAGIVGTFQLAYNAHGGGHLATDDKYGPLTRAALQDVLNQIPSGPPSQAPAACSYTSAPAPSPRPAPSPGSPTAPVLQLGAGSILTSPWAWAIAALAAAVVLVPKKHKPRWLRKAGL
jgi:hypothetical protein